MELILLLTALLSALSGAAVQSRAGEAQVHQLVSGTAVAATRAPVRVARVASRPALPLASLPDARRIASPLRLFSLAATVPLYASRLRE